ncbi:MAG: FecR domain-containing protein [Gammaproteobacteria bacterium]
MITTHEPPGGSANQIEEKAAEWVARIDLRGTPDEWAALDTWLAKNQRHRAAFLRLSAAWVRMNSLRGLAPLDGEADPDLLDPRRYSSHEQDYHTTEEPQSRIGSFLRAPAFRAAATVVAFAAIALVGYVAWSTSGRAPLETYSTALGEVRKVTLSDNSVVALNTNSLVNVRYTSRGRQLELVRGEALFTVAHNAKRPFDVKASGTVVRAVGTEFSVRLRDELSIDVLVSAGRIAINPPAHSTLSAGMTARVRSGRIVARSLSSDDISDRLSWTTGHLAFHGQTLGEVASEINRYNSIKLLVSDPKLAGLRIGGNFKATEPERFATTLEHTYPIRAHHLGARGEVIRLESGAK